jgi:hypothetical protein
VSEMVTPRAVEVVAGCVLLCGHSFLPYVALCVRRELLDTAERHQLGESERVASLQASLEASLASLRHQVRRVQCFSPHCLPA